MLRTLHVKNVNLSAKVAPLSGLSQRRKHRMAYDSIKTISIFRSWLMRILIRHTTHKRSVFPRLNERYFHRVKGDFGFYCTVEPGSDTESIGSEVGNCGFIKRFFQS